MKKIIFMRGIPASGKSTEAIKMLNDKSFVRINKDLIRLILLSFNKDMSFDTALLRKMLFGNSSSNICPEIEKEVINSLTLLFSKNNMQGKLKKAAISKSFAPLEKITLETQTALVKLFVKLNKNFIVDDTNINTIHISRIKSLSKDYTYEIYDMHEKHKIGLDECLKRNSLRTGKEKVPDIAIRSMWNKYSMSKSNVSYQPFNTYKQIVVVDLDGTLADVNHRLHHIQKEPKDWDNFFKEMDKDTVREEIKSLVYDGYPECEVVIVSGRPDSYKEVTEKWLEQNDIIYSAIYMRGANDRRKDTEVKQEIIDLYLPKEKIKVWIDDREEVIEQVRLNNICVLNVDFNKILNIGDKK